MARTSPVRSDHHRRRAYSATFRMRKKSKIWFKVRLGLISLSLFGGLFTFPDPDDPED